MSSIDNTATSYNFADDDVSLKELLSPLWNRRWKIVTLTLLVSLTVAFYVSLLKPRYQSSAILQIGSNISANALSLNDALNNETAASYELIQTQYEILRSRKFAERVVAQLNLIEHPEFRVNKYNDKLPFLADGDLSEKPSLSSVVGQFRSQLTISPISDTELVKITFKSYYPELTMKVANQVGQTYLQYQNEIHSSTKENTSQWLVDQLEELGMKLDSSELALQQFIESEGLVDVNGISGLVSDEIGALTAASIKAEKERDDLKVSYDYIKQHKGNLSKLAEIKEVNSHSSYIQLRNAQEKIERKISELSGRYGPKHPKMLAVRAELETIEASIRQQIEEHVLSIEKEYLTTIEKVKATKSRLTSAKADFLRLSRLKNQFSQLQRDVDTNKELYNSYLIRLKETDAMGNYTATFYVRFLDKAITPKGPFAPRKSLYVMMSFILSLVAVSLYVIMRELLGDTLNSRRKLENFSEAPVLAVLPRFKTKTTKDEDNYLTDSRFTEAIRTLRTSLLFSSDKKPPKVVAVTSSVPNEGKSTVALHLARSYSEMEKVLLIEADMRHPTVAKNLHLDPFRPGLSNLLAKTHQINECIVRDKHVKLDILTSGISPANPLAFLSMKRFDMLIKVFGNFYDRIIIETPPVNAVSDAVIISRVVESVLYVVHGTKTKREQITSGLRMLKQAKAPVEGIVINQSESIDTSRYQNKYYNDRGNIIKLPVRKQG
ncbi:polysaccharide biosynthesis tyrosine autokinase [Thalassotalea sp. M1531]|uniref:non-specific protein-tyrosine kinase n=1 Tax=Thalassotalea algicola TaxID=2716224 RepID=A0A7Y0Q7Q8_9GAMM|nr:polysaccharide biosynthesis tyrosine autokinase [Thalassotalea algicola]NMP33334.1 polysaccharide biosynthesis tyrosine autokinase [Thalassotalea algicola]